MAHFIRGGEGFMAEEAFTETGRRVAESPGGRGTAGLGRGAISVGKATGEIAGELGGGVASTVGGMASSAKDRLGKAAQQAKKEFGEDKHGHKNWESKHSSSKRERTIGIRCDKGG